MLKFEILCVTMNQTDFSKIQEMNIHSNVVFANQAGTVRYDEYEFDGHKAKMITTNTRGVGINRNMCLSYASGDICLFADDDLVYFDDVEEMVVSEFNEHPDADIFIFHLETDSKDRKQKKYKSTKKYCVWKGMPWGAFRIAVRLSSIRKNNIWFTTLFGGGCIFPSGEDSMWLQEAVDKRLNIYVSKFTIGTISFKQSSWFNGYNEKYFFAKGAYYQAVHPKTFYLWMYYFSWRSKRLCSMKKKDKLKWMKIGRKCYKELIPYEEFIDKEE